MSLVWRPVLLLLAVLLTSRSSYAYFEFGLQTRSVQATLTRSDTIPSTASHVVALSDNDEFHHFFYLNGRIPPGDLPHFIYADYLPVDEIVSQVHDRTLSREFGVTDLLYANLRLVELIDEYEALKANAAAALAGLSVPYLQQGPAYVDRPIALSADNISTMMDKVADQSQLGAGVDLPAFLAQRGPEGAGGAKSYQPRLQKRSFHQLPALNSYRPKAYSGRAIRSPASGSSAGGTALGDGEDPRLQYGVDPRDEKPWPVRLIIYIFSNKFLAILFFACIYIAFWLLSHLRKK